MSKIEAMIPFLGGSYTGRSPNVNAQRSVNCWPEIDPKEAKNIIAMYQTPGFEKWLDLSSATYSDSLLVSIPPSGQGSGYSRQDILTLTGSRSSPVLVKVLDIEETVTAPGLDYHVGDVLTLTLTDHNDCTCQVLSIGVNGEVGSVRLIDAGNAAYDSSTAYPTTVSPAGGTGCTITRSGKVREIRITSEGSGTLAPGTCATTAAPSGGTGCTISVAATDRNDVRCSLWNEYSKTFFAIVGCRVFKIVGDTPALLGYLSPERRFFSAYMATNGKQVIIIDGGAVGYYIEAAGAHGKIETITTALDSPGVGSGWVVGDQATIDTGSADALVEVAAIYGTDTAGAVKTLSLVGGGTNGYFVSIANPTTPTNNLARKGVKTIAGVPTSGHKGTGYLATDTLEINPAGGSYYPIATVTGITVDVNGAVQTLPTTPTTPGTKGYTATTGVTTTNQRKNVWSILGIVAGGSGYHIGEVLLIDDGDGKASVIITATGGLGETGPVTAVTLLEHGITGYTDDGGTGRATEVLLGVVKTVWTNVGQHGNPGVGYSNGDILTLTGGNKSDVTVRVTDVEGGTGQVLKVELVSGGTAGGYVDDTIYETTVSPSGGHGCTIEVGETWTAGSDCTLQIYTGPAATGCQVDVTATEDEVGEDLTVDILTLVAGVVGTELNEIDDPDFPPGADTVAYQNGMVMVTVNYGNEQSNPGLLYFSDLYDVTAWNILTFAEAESDPDSAMRVATNRHDAWIFGDYTVEIFADTGDADTPFARINGGVLDIGIWAPASVRNIGGVMFWLNDKGQVARNIGYTYEIISTSHIEHAISQIPKTDDAIGMTYSYEGHPFYVLTFPNGGDTSKSTTLVYDALTGYWHEWRSLITGKSATDINGVPDLTSFGRHRANCIEAIGEQYIVGDYENGLLYKLDFSVYTDNSNSIIRLRRSQAINKDSLWVIMYQLKLAFEKTYGITPTYYFRYSDDGGNTWSDYISTNLVDAGLYAGFAIWRSLGKFRERILEISMINDSSKFVLQGAYARLEGCSC